MQSFRTSDLNPGPLGYSAGFLQIESQRLEDVDNPNAQIGIQFLYKENFIHFDF